VFSPHTGYDSAEEGINQQLAELFELDAIGVLRPTCAEDASIGAGRFGTLLKALPLGELLDLSKERLNLEQLQFVGDENAPIERLGVACGSAAEFLPDAQRHGCQALLTGEARFHACLEAREIGVALILPGHYATERLGMERLAAVLGDHFPQLSVWASRVERDPLRWA
jgi:putative NIF3 family GTP cyclohydrolase 1 type 2